MRALDSSRSVPTVGVVATGSEVTPRFFSMAYLDAMFGAGEQWRVLKYSAFYAPGGEFLLYSVMIALGGLTQWLFLRRHVGWAHWWALPVPLYFGFVYLTKEVTLAVGGGIWLIASAPSARASSTTSCYRLSLPSSLPLRSPSPPFRSKLNCVEN